MKRITAAVDVYEEFWDLHESGYETGTKLEKIIDDLGYDDAFFPDNDKFDPSATDNQYREVLDIYYGRGGSKYKSDDELLADIIDAVSEIEGVSNVRSFEDAGMMTNNKGFVFSRNGEECQFEWLGKY